MELTDGQWELLKPLVEPRTPRKRRGRPWRDTRQVVEGVLWILRTGAQWAELPKDKFPPYQTCHRRFQRWVREGTLVQVLRALAEDLRDGQDFNCAIWLHKARSLPTEDFKREVEKELTGREEEP